MNKRVVLHVRGMDCIVCEMNVVRTLEEMEGVEKAEASFPEKRAVVHFDDAIVNPDSMRRALFKIGFVGSLTDDQT